MVVNSLSFCLSVKLLISPSYLNEILAGHSNLGCRLFSFITLSMEKEMATNSSILAWRIPGTAEPGGLLSMGSCRVGHDWSNLAAAAAELLNSPSYLSEILAGYSNVGCRFYSFITLSMSCHSLLAWRISVERSAVILMGIPLYVTCCFSLAAFNICSLCLIFVNLINMCLGVFHLGFILFGTLWVSWTWVISSFPVLGKFSTIISSSIF